MRKILLIKIFLFCTLLVNAQVYLRTETKRLNKSQVVSTKSEILLDLVTGTMHINYSKPDKFYVQTNTFGEMTVYFPEANEVLKERNTFFSSKSDLIYHFFTQQSNDLGLSQSGFIIKETKYEEAYLVTFWETPVQNNKFVKAKLVQEDYLPIYLAFYDEEGKKLQETYFSDWQYDKMAVFPARITQIDKISETDSIISKKEYYDVVTGESAGERLIIPEIPADAKLISLSKEEEDDEKE